MAEAAAHRLPATTTKMTNRIFEKTDAGYSVTGYEGTPTVVVIPDTHEGLPVTSIGYMAFQFCTSLTSVTIPASVTSIGIGAFLYCTSLTSVTIPDSVKSIGDYAFAYCSSLTSVTIPDSVKSIGDYAFSGCDSLTSITIPDSVTSIGELAFGYCPSLERLTVAPGNPVYRSAGNCIIETETGTLIKGCNNSVIPSDGSVKSIGDYAFAYCDSLTSVTIPDSVKSIGDGAFLYCDSLTSITIPDSVASIGGGAFEGCTSLERLTVAPGNPVYRSAGNCIIETETGTLIQGCQLYNRDRDRHAHPRLQ